MIIESELELELAGVPAWVPDRPQVRILRSHAWCRASEVAAMLP